MWLEKLFIIYLLTLFNSMDGYYLDNHFHRSGRHRRKGECNYNCHYSLLSYIHIKHEHDSDAKIMNLFILAYLHSSCSTHCNGKSSIMSAFSLLQF